MATFRDNCPNCGFSLKFPQGRPKIVDKERVKELRKLGLTIQAIADRLCISNGSVHNALKK